MVNRLQRRIEDSFILKEDFCWLCIVVEAIESNELQDHVL
jgi:hypothetical protein